MSPRPRHGAYTKALAPPAEHEGWTITPVKLDLDADPLTDEYGLEPVLEGHVVPEPLYQLLEMRFDALWVRARVEAIFPGLQSPAEDQRIEMSCMEYGLLLERERPQPAALLVRLSDENGESYVGFSEREQDEDLMRDVMGAVADLVYLSDAADGDFAEFQDTTFNDFYGSAFAIGCQGGDFFLQAQDPEVARLLETEGPEYFERLHGYDDSED
ncbi:MAG: hypothetical protein RLY93_05130 [Sumerlaeia bacterium]